MLQELFFAVLLPGLIATVVAVVACRPWRKRDQRDTPAWCAPLVMGIGFLICYRAVEGWPTWPPHERWQWTVWLALVVAVIGLLPSLRKDGLLLSLATAGLAAVATALLVRPPGLDGVMARTGLGIAVLALAASVEPLARRRPGPMLPLAVVIMAAFSAALLFESGSVKLSLLTASIAAAR